MQLNKLSADIVTPKNTRLISKDLLKLCELFISCLLNTKAKQLDIAIDIAARVVTCPDKKSKEIIQLIIGAGKFNGFADQLIELLHTSLDENATGDLICREDGNTVKFTLYDVSKTSKAWRVSFNQS